MSKKRKSPNIITNGREAVFTWRYADLAKMCMTPYFS